MYDFVSHILRRYFEATGWNEHNSYLNLTASSSALLDFTIPSGLSLSISAAPSSSFFTSYRLAPLPNLRGGIGYIYTSTDEPLDIGSSSRDVNFKHIIERFRITEAPRRPLPKEPTWHRGQRLDLKRDYLIYGCMHLPSSRLDALYTVRLSPTWQLLVTAVSTPPKYPLDALASSLSTSAAALAASNSRQSITDSNPNLAASASSATGLSGSSSSGAVAAANAAAASTSSLGAGPPGSTNLQFTLQNDTGRWFTEYSYSADDALWGFRVLHNFGTPSTASPSSNSSASVTVEAPSNGGNTAGSLALSQPTATAAGLGPSGIAAASSTEKRRINESGLASDERTDSEPDSAVGGGLRGRFSAGAEVFVSTVEKSAGLSTGIRFATLPEPSSSTSGQPSQPPTVLTATLNPMMGHLSTAYAARMARDLVVCSRFDFNVYSYDSELSIGAEYWLRAVASSSSSMPAPASIPSRRAAFSTLSPSIDADAETTLTTAATSPLAPPPALVSNDPAPPTALPPQLDTEPLASTTTGNPIIAPTPTPAPAAAATAPITGVLKARLSTTSDIRLLWQGRMRNCIVALGVRADLDAATSGVAAAGGGGGTRKGSGIVRSVGVEIMYFS